MTKDNSTAPEWRAPRAFVFHGNAKKWLREHNPYPEWSSSHHRFAAAFWRDQAEAIFDPKRSTLEVVKRVSLTVALVAAVFGVVAAVMSVVTA